MNKPIYNIGDEVWVMSDNKVSCGLIDRIRLEVDNKNNTFIQYGVVRKEENHPNKGEADGDDDHHRKIFDEYYFKEVSIYPTKQDLINSL